MIPFIRTHSELMAITESRDSQVELSKINEINSSNLDSAQRRRYIKSLDKKQVDLPDLPKTIKHKWVKNKESITRFFNALDYNNQIQASYDLTLLERQNNNNQQDAA